MYAASIGSSVPRTRATSSNRKPTATRSSSRRSRFWVSTSVAKATKPSVVLHDLAGADAVTGCGRDAWRASLLPLIPGARRAIVIPVAHDSSRRVALRRRFRWRAPLRCAVSIRCRGLRIADRVLVVRLGARSATWCERCRPCRRCGRFWPGAHVVAGRARSAGVLEGQPWIDEVMRVSARRNQHGAASGTPAAGGAAVARCVATLARVASTSCSTSIRS